MFWGQSNYNSFVIAFSVTIAVIHSSILHVQVFTLPKVSAKMKLKLTALDGSRVRRAGVAWFGSSRSEDYCESGMVVLTNQGDLHVVSLPNVKMQVQYPCIRREDVSGIASCVFTKYGQGKNYKHLAFGLFLHKFSWLWVMLQLLSNCSNYEHP